MSEATAGREPAPRGFPAMVARTFVSLRVPTFRRYSVGALLAYTGSWMVQLTQSLLILDLGRGSGTLLGVTLALQALPLLLFGPWTGVLADRIGARRMLMIGEVTMLVVTLTQATLNLVGALTVAGVLALAALFGVGAVMEQTMRTAVVAELVPPHRIGNAVSLNALFLQLGRFLGPAAAGWLITVSGYTLPFLVGATFFGGFAVLLATITPVARALSPGHAVGLGAALRFVRADPVLPEILILAAVGGLVGPNYMTFATLVLTKDFGASPSVVGTAAMFLAAGTITGALVAAWLNATSARLVRVGAAGVGAAAVLGDVAPSATWYMLSLGVAGFCAMMLVTQSGSSVQARTPAHLRGRVSALFSICLLAGVPLGAPLFGAVADGIGPRPTSGVFGAVVVLIVGLAGALFAVRRRRR